MSTAVIAATRVGAAHDGAAELVVTLRHAGGGESEVRLDEPAAAALLDACGAAETEELAGVGWERVRDALRSSWNRLAAPTSRAEQGHGMTVRNNGTEP
ncbi:MAG: hypothetical protein OXJ53_01535 [Gammaproteobacteria bacterium]|nr:hypothetical protein [Gammaproteobacteria bacterium]MDE0273426.1 hypothetical protein [Gammaproteobacteria bacterium]